MTDGARHLAQLNVGRLVAETDDPRVAEFMAALDRVNGLGKRMPGFVWMMEGSGEPGTGNTETKIGGDPRFVSNLTVWESVEALEHFVWNTVHRRSTSGAPSGSSCWATALRDVVGAGGHRPTLDEALARLDHLRANGDSDHAFGWAHVEAARLWREKNCSALAAE